MAKVQKGLGRGLGALLDTNMTDTVTEVPEKKAAVGGAVNEVDILEIDVNKAQPRKDFDPEALEELKNSILEHGIIQPLVVRKEGERYLLIAGERRYRAARLAGLKKVPIIIREADEKATLELSLIENIQREDLNPVEEALAIKSLMEELSYTQEEAAKRLSKSRSALANSLRLLSLPNEILKDLREGKITAGHARAILMLDGAEKMLEAEKRIIEEGLNVRQAEELAKQLGEEKPIAEVPVKRESYRSPEFAEAERQLSERFETKVKISGSPKKGKIIFEYKSEEQLMAIYSLLSERSD